MKRVRWTTVLALAGVLVVGGVAVAQDRVGAVGAVVAQDGATAFVDEAARIQADRAGIISELMGMWAPARGAFQLEIALQRASAAKLLQVSRAGSFEEVERILLGATAGAPFGEFVPNALGDTDQDYLYTPVTPCRIFDTRNVGGSIPAGGTRDFYVYGGGLDIIQGGDPAGCPAPKGEPRGVHLNVTVVPVGAQGNIRVYPADAATPNASAVNFKLGTNIANALTVQSFYSLGPEEIQVFAGAGAAHVLADVLGYYYDVELTLGSGQTLTGVYSAHTASAATGEFFMASFSYGIELPSAPSAPSANFIPVGGSSTTNCPGSATSPSALPGNLCVYERVNVDSTYGCIFGPQSGACNSMSTFGAGVSFSATNAGRTLSYGTWAVTAP
jgi:hypothetical protein